MTRRGDLEPTSWCQWVIRWWRYLRWQCVICGVDSKKWGRGLCFDCYLWAEGLDDDPPR